MSTLHPSFLFALVAKITSTILTIAEPDGFETGEGKISLDASSTQELSYQICAASWANWLLNRFEDPNEPDEEEQEEKRLKAVAALVAGLGLAGKAGGSDYKAYALPSFRPAPRLTRR